MINKPSTSFILTKEYYRFEEFAQACESFKYIGICYGKPGVGKTQSAKNYAQTHPIDKAHFIETLDQQTKQLIEKSRAVYYAASITDSPKQLSQAIYREISRFGGAYLRAQGNINWEDILLKAHEHCPLVIVDEADCLNHKTLEQLRHLYDKYSFGLVLIGMPGFEKRLSRYPQLFSRIGFAHEFQLLSFDETEFIIEQHWNQLGLQLDKKQFSNVEALKAMVQITQGNFRLIRRMLDQINRLHQINHFKTIDLDVIHAARDCLVIG